MRQCEAATLDPHIAFTAADRDSRRRAAHGMYKIDANYFGSRARRLLEPLTVQMDVLTNYGRPNEPRTSLTLRLKEAQERGQIGEIELWDRNQSPSGSRLCWLLPEQRERVETAEFFQLVQQHVVHRYPEQPAKALHQPA